MPVFAPAPDYWTGFYVGVVGGVANFETETTDYWCWFACDAPTLTEYDFTIGGTVGYNHLLSSNFLIGIEADLSTGPSASNRTTYNDDPDGVVWSGEWDYLATVRGRAGLVIDRALIYTTAGLAIAEGNYSAREFIDGETSCGTAGYDCADWSGTQYGLVAGAGVEYKFTDNLSLKSEYLYVGFSSESGCWYSGSGCINSVGANDDRVDWKSSAHLFRVGLNYGF